METLSSVTDQTASSRSRQQWRADVDTALQTQGLEVAARLAEQALADGIEEASLLNLAASTRFQEQRYDEALRLLQRANALAPNDPNVLNSLGVCLKATGETGHALQAFEAAISIDPVMAQAHFNRGTVLDDRGDLRAARSGYEQALALDPDYLDARAALAWIDAQTGDAPSAKSNGVSVLASAPDNILACMAVSSADLQQGNLAAAAARLTPLSQDPGLSPVNRSIVVGMIADIYDATNRPAEAFAIYGASNTLLRTLHPEFEAAGRETAIDRVRRLTSWFERAERAEWHTAPEADTAAGGGPAAHIFLVGFPRSGTTLLENVLAAHPKVVSLEEKPLLDEAEAAYLTSNEALKRLAQIGPDEAHHYRDAYWSAVRSFGVEPSGRVFIDKMPLASVQLPIIAKLFPEARILFAIRDPRDVVLSCFRRRFAMNASMYELLTLEGAAAYYDAVMRLSELYRGILPLPQQVVRYESLVDNFEGTARAAFEFLGLEWDPSVADFAEKARTRGINTPSAAQVVRGLNREGQGTWRRYRDQMAPILPLLEPWAERFGYASE